MATDIENCNPADSGPFQKYLLSGACYVQIGQCYGLVQHAIERGQNLEDSHDLVQQLATIWQQYVLKPVAEAASHWPTPDQPEQDLQTNWSEQLKQEIQQSGRLAVTDLLRSLDTLAPDRLDLEQFFLLWVRACDHAYVELIRSEAVSRAMGETVTNLFRAMATQPGSVQSAPTQAKQASREK